MLMPTGFKQGSRAELDTALKKVRALLPEKTKEEWENFCELAPDSDDVNEYLRKFPDAMCVFLFSDYTLLFLLI